MPPCRLAYDTDRVRSINELVISVILAFYAVSVSFGDTESEGIEADAIKCLNMAIEALHRAENFGMEILVERNTYWK